MFAHAAKGCDQLSRCAEVTNDVERKLVALGIVVAAVVGGTSDFSSASPRAFDLDTSPLVAGRVTIHAPSLVPSDHPIPLYGTAEGAAPGEMVEIESKDCGTTFFRGASATRTQRAGQWSAEFYPGITTWVRAVWKGRASKAVRCASRQRFNSRRGRLDDTGSSSVWLRERSSGIERLRSSDTALATVSGKSSARFCLRLRTLRGRSYGHRASSRLGCRRGRR